MEIKDIVVKNRNKVYVPSWEMYTHSIKQIIQKMSTKAMSAIKTVK